MAESLLKHKFTWGIIAVAVILVIIVLLANRSGTAHNRLVGEALAALAAADTLHTDVRLTINLPEQMRNQKRPFTRVHGQIAGDVRRTDTGAEFVGTLDGETRGKGNAFFFVGDLFFVESGAMFRLDEFPVLLNRSGSLIDRWTHVAQPMLTVSEDAPLMPALLTLIEVAEARSESATGDSAHATFDLPLTAEHEAVLADAFRKELTGNPALDVLARLLDANNVESLELTVNRDTKEIVELKAHFVRPISEGRTFDFAELVLSFTEYGKSVAVNPPQAELTVRPDVFARIFGQGEVADVETEEAPE